MKDEWATKQIDRFRRQYLQVERVLDYPHGQLLKLAEVQDAIYNSLFADGAVPRGPPARYQLRVLKELVQRIEAAIDNWDDYGVSDDLMTAFSMLLYAPLPSETASVQQKCYVSYHLSSLSNSGPPSDPTPLVNEPYITLLENRTLIAASGTTGLRTWEAALHLGQYLSQNTGIVKGKRILEVGAGTGFLSILCTKYLGSSHAIASDGSDDVINNLPENLYLNQLEDTSLVRPMDVKWGHALVGTENDRWNDGQEVDVILGADVTYHERVIAALVATLMELFEMHPHVHAYLSVTHRREQTFQSFLDTCYKNQLDVEDQHFDIPGRGLQDGPFYSDQIPIRICKVSKA